MRDYLIWVGKEFYETPEGYIKEAEELGCCRKIPHTSLSVIEQHLKVGETRIWLVHKDTDEPVVFAYYILDGIISCSLQQEIIDEVRSGIPVTAMNATARARIPQRGCGSLDPPSYYLVGPQDITVQLGLRKPGTDIKERIFVLPNPIKVKVKHFRGIKAVKTRLKRKLERPPLFKEF